MIDQFNSLIASNSYSISMDSHSDHDSFIYSENGNTLNIKLIGPYDRSSKTSEISIRAHLQGKYTLPIVN